MKGRAPTAEERAWMDEIVQLGCIVCRVHLEELSPAEVHHLSGKTASGAHLNSIPLCWAHHRSGYDTPACTSRHPFKARFELRYGLETDLHGQTVALVRQIQEGEPIATA